MYVIYNLQQGRRFPYIIHQYNKYDADILFMRYDVGLSNPQLLQMYIFILNRNKVLDTLLGQ